MSKRFPVPHPGDHEPIAGPHDVSLRPIVEGDIEQFMRWLQEPDVAHWWDEADSSLEEIRSEYFEPDPAYPCWRFIIVWQGRDVGLIQYYHDYPDADALFSAGVDILIGEADARDRGVGREAIRVLLQYLFEVKRLHRVTIDPEVGNARAIRSYEAAGFTRDGVSRDNDFIRGAYVDTLYLSILEGEWPAAKARWLAERGT